MGAWSVGDERRRSATGAHAAVRRGVPTWADPRPAPDAHAAQAVAVALRFLEGQGWVRLLEARRGPAGGTEHVVVGPPGVVVLHVVPQPDAHRRRRARTADAQVAAAEAVAVAGRVTALLPPRQRSTVRAVVCTPGAAPAVDGPVTVVGGDALAAHLRGLPVRLGDAGVVGVAEHLRARLAGRSVLLTTAALDAGRPVLPERPAPTRGGLALRLGVVVSVSWLAWAFTTAPLGLT